MSVLTAFFTFIIFKINLNKKARETKKLINNIGEKTSAWDYDYICNRAREAFFAFHKMLGTGDKLCIEEFVTADFYDDIDNRFLLSAVNRSSSDKITIKEIAPVDASDFEDDTLDTVWIYINGTSTNCSIDAQVDACLSETNKNAAKHGEYWQFVRREDNWLLNNIVYR